jgi:sec-independent protein translocase protein TatA
MGGVSIWHWIIVGIVVMLLFGRGKVSELMGDVAKGIKAFKKGMSDDEVAASEPVRPAEAVKPLEDQRGTVVQTPAGERKAS